MFLTLCFAVERCSGARGWFVDGAFRVISCVRNARFIRIAAGAYHNLALKNDGTVVAWGENCYGQATVPAGLSGVVAIAAGALHSLALKNDGTVVAWGR